VPDVRVLTDAAAGVHLARLRDRATQPADFQRHARLLGALLALEAVRDVPTTTTAVHTPLTTASATVPANQIVAVPVLRAGLGLLPGLQDLLPTASVGMVGLERDEKTLEPAEYYRKVPPLDDAWVLLLEPMLATGGSAAAAVRALSGEGAARVAVLSVVATQTAIDRIVDAVDEDVMIVTAAIDPTLDDNGYIVPGLGDFGDRLFGTVH
jgi:uracil phosphoribosyltransferase